MALARILELLRRSPHPRIVVTGMPKSGTTAVAMLLGAASGLTVNSDPFYRLDRAGIVFRDPLYAGTLPLRELLLRNARFFRGGLVKDPNFIYLPELFTAFPAAGFVFVVRDPRDNIRSLLNRLKLPGRMTAAPAQLESVTDTWRRVLEGRTPDVPGSNYIERLAHRWALAARRYQDAADRMTVIPYEVFNAGKTGAVEATLAALGVRGGRRIEHLLDTEFQPKGQRGIAATEFFGADELLAIEQICAPGMDHFGYNANQRSA